MSVRRTRQTKAQGEAQRNSGKCCKDRLSPWYGRQISTERSVARLPRKKRRKPRVRCASPWALLCRVLRTLVESLHPPLTMRRILAAAIHLYLRINRERLGSAGIVGINQYMNQHGAVEYQPRYVVRQRNKVRPIRQTAASATLHPGCFASPSGIEFHLCNYWIGKVESRQWLERAIWPDHSRLSDQRR